MIVLRANSQRLQRVTFIPNANLLAASGEGGNVYLWNLTNQSLHQSIKVGSAGVGILSAAQNGSYLLVGGGGEPSRWEPPATESTRLLPGQVWPDSIAFSPSGDRLAIRQRGSNGGLTCYSLPDERLLWRGAFSSLAYWKPVLFSKDGTEVMTAEGKELYFFRAGTGGESRPAIQVPTPVSHFDLSPDGKLLALSAQQRLLIWRLDPPGEVAAFSNRPKHFQACAFHPNGSFLATVSGDGKVRCFDARSWSELPGFEWSIGPLRDVAFSADGMLAASCSERGKIVVWDVD
jgi:WD40 repeat protein